MPRAQKASWKTLGLFTYRLLLLIIWATLALPGVVLNGPIFILASMISRKKQKGVELFWIVKFHVLMCDAEALAASIVKVEARDVLASWKIIISLIIMPLLYGFYAFLAFMVTVRANMPLSWRLWAPFLTMIALPVMSYAALKFGEAGMDVLKCVKQIHNSLLYL